MSRKSEVTIEHLNDSMSSIHSDGGSLAAELQAKLNSSNSMEPKI